MCNTYNLTLVNLMIIILKQKPVINKKGPYINISLNIFQIIYLWTFYTYNYRIPPTCSHFGH